MPAKIKSFVNLLLHTATLVSKFALVFVLAKFLESAEVGLYGLLVATIAFVVGALGFSFYTYSTRELIASFVGLDAFFEDLKQDESMILRFRNLLEKHDLTVAIFAAVLSEKGLSRRRRPEPDSTLITPPRSAMISDEKRDPEVTQTKKGCQWHFGMKAPIGVDAESGQHGEENLALGERGG